MTITPARDALRNVICAQAASDTDAEAKLDAHATEAVQQFAEQVAVKLAGCCDECNACIAELRRLAAAARPDRVPTRAEIADQVRVVDASQRHVDDLLAAYHRTAARPDNTQE